MGQLFIVSTPIGNLKDITLRALEILQSVDVILCEDTRKTGLILQRYNDIRIYGYKENASADQPQSVNPASPAGGTPNPLLPNHPRLLSYYEHNEFQRIPQVIQFLKEGKNVALVSNAGTPTISDPGFKLVRECIKESIPVISIPGASSILAALTSSGLPTDKFIFLGFLPRKEKAKTDLISSMGTMTNNSSIEHISIVCFESPYRLLKTLATLTASLGNRQIVVCREMTKIHEEIKRGTTEEMKTFYEKHMPKGEITLVFEMGKREKGL